MSELEELIFRIPLVDSHEHMIRDKVYVETMPDLLLEIFGSYTPQDLISAGATQQAVDQLLDRNNPDIAGRFRGIQPAWGAIRHGGYGQVSRAIARLFFGIEEITPQSLTEAHEKFDRRDRRGERLRMMRDVANLDHVQIDDSLWTEPYEVSGPEFFFHDLSWMDFCCTTIDADGLEERTGKPVKDLKSLRAAMEFIFVHRPACTVAVKTQHAYHRTLAWSPRTAAEVEPILQRKLQGKPNTEAELLCLGDWMLAQGVELAGECGLPVKIHTGYLAGNNYMNVDRMRVGQLCPLLQHYPGTRFDLFHIGYGHQMELLTIAKHYANVSVDMCWAWGLDPYTAQMFLRQAIHAMPLNKLFVFGGDCFYPGATIGFAYQARIWIQRALQMEIDEGWMSFKEAEALAWRLMHHNQREYFGIEQAQARVRALAAAAKHRESVEK